MMLRESNLSLEFKVCPTKRAYKRSSGMLNPAIYGSPFGEGEAEALYDLSLYSDGRQPVLFLNRELKYAAFG